MAISYPTLIMDLGVVSTMYDDSGVTKLNNYHQCIPVGPYKTTRPPSFFQERPVEGGNDVCHVKCLSMAIKDEYDLPYAIGRYRTTAANQPGTTSPSLGLKYYLCQGNRSFTYSVEIATDRSYYTTTLYTFTCYHFIGIDRKGRVVYARDGIINANYQYRYDGYVVCKISSYDGYPKGVRDDFLEVVKTISYKAILHERASFDLVNSTLETLMALFKPDEYTPYETTGVKPKHLSAESSLVPEVLQSSLLLSEYDLIFLGGVGKPYSAYHLKALRQASYLDALDHVPQLNDNSLSNVLELVSFIKGIVIDHRIEIPKSLQSAWLAYRYSYGTTKLDVEEAISFVHRNVNSDFLEKGFSCYGRATQIISGTPITVKCRLDVKQKEMDYLDKIWTSLYRYGLTPSFYVVWDMIPYSFIVDWFIPVGDILNGYDKTRMYDRTYDIDNVWFSCQYNLIIEGSSCKAYTRWREEALPEYEGYYVLENKGTPSDKVIGFRILDAASLLIR